MYTLLFQYIKWVYHNIKMSIGIKISKEICEEYKIFLHWNLTTLKIESYILCLKFKRGDFNLLLFYLFSLILLVIHLKIGVFYKKMRDFFFHTLTFGPDVPFYHIPYFFTNLLSWKVKFTYFSPVFDHIFTRRITWIYSFEKII